MKTSISHSISRFAAATLLLVVPGLDKAEAGAVQTIHPFDLSPEGGYPYSAVVGGTDGMFYGTTSSGGTNSLGTIYRIDTSGTLTVLHHFAAGEGTGQVAGLHLGQDGKLYGACQQGGANNYGTLYRITTSGSFESMFSFSGTNGSNPVSSMVTGTDGNLYGIARSGGSNSYGAIYRLTTSGSFQVIHPLVYSDGYSSEASLVPGSDGQLYGVGQYGGSNGAGTVFKVTTSGSLTVLHSFEWSNGYYPRTTLCRGSDGNFYGMTTYGGDFGYGIIFQIAAGGSFTKLASLTSFWASGNYIYGPLAQIPDGAFYGATSNGGDASGGTIFKMIVSGSAGTLKTVHSFDSAGGSAPRGGLITGTDGNLHGIATYGGANGAGAFFRFLPHAPEFSAGPTAIGAHQMQLSGTVNPNGTETSAYFDYGTTTSYGNSTAPQAMGSGTADVVYNPAPIPGLSQTTTYYYRLVVTSSIYGTFQGNAQYLYTLPEPTITQNAASNIQTSSVLLSGTVNPNGYDTEVYFLYGTGTGYGSQTTSVAMGNASNNVPVRIPEYGLLPNTTYHFVLTTTGAAGTFQGSDDTFTTPPVIPGFTQNSAQNISAGGATISGTVSPNGSVTTVYFEYGLTNTYGNSTPIQEIGNGTSPLSVSAALSGLQPGSEYHYRMVIANADGASQGTDQTFNTPAVSATTVIEAVTGDEADDIPGTTFRAFGPPIVNSSGHVAFLAALASGSTSVTGSNNKAIWADDGAGTRTLLARIGSTAPGTGGGVFHELGNPVYNGVDEVAFIGRVKPRTGDATLQNQSGIWSSVGGSLALAQRQEDQADGCAAGVVYSKFQSLALSDAGLVFSARLSGAGVTGRNDLGIWFVNGADGQAHLVARTGNQIPVNSAAKTISTLTVFPLLPGVGGQSRTVDGLAANIVYQATFTDGSTAVLSFRVR